MNLTSIKTTKEIFLRHGIRPFKGLGQNFLINEAVLSKITATAELKPDDIVLEIGPGIGTLTAELAKKVKKVIAVEKDPKMIEILAETLKNYQNVEIINEDILKTLNFKLEILNYKVVANIPYYITAPLIRKLLESENQPRAIVLMVQKEVAQRICANPPRMSLLAVSVQFYAKAKIVSYVPKNYFWPRPEVDSAIIKIEPFADQPKKESVKKFFLIARTGFSHPRKQLLNNFSNSLSANKEEIKKWLTANNLNPTQRAESLSMKDWLSLTQSFPL